MTINETLLNSESISDFKRTFENPDTMVYSSGREAAVAGYGVQDLASSKDVNVLNVSKTHNTLPPVSDRNFDR